MYGACTFYIYIYISIIVLWIFYCELKLKNFEVFIDHLFFYIVSLNYISKLLFNKTRFLTRIRIVTRFKGIYNHFVRFTLQIVLHFFFFKERREASIGGQLKPFPSDSDEAFENRVSRHFFRNQNFSRGHDCILITQTKSFQRGTEWGCFFPFSRVSHRFTFPLVNSVLLDDFKVSFVLNDRLKPRSPRGIRLLSGALETTMSRKLELINERERDELTKHKFVFIFVRKESSRFRLYFSLKFHFKNFP